MQLPCHRDGLMDQALVTPQPSAMHHYGANNGMTRLLLVQIAPQSEIQPRRLGIGGARDRFGCMARPGLRLKPGTPGVGVAILASFAFLEHPMAHALPAPPRTFQDLIFALQKYWSERGCIVLQPYDMEMGAGTFHAATFLRAVGPEPWSAAYVQPSRRPTDGRYGDNPFRLQHYYQFQVCIKPSPDDFQELYLGSLR